MIIHVIKVLIGCCCCLHAIPILQKLTDMTDSEKKDEMCQVDNHLAGQWALLNKHTT